MATVRAGNSAEIIEIQRRMAQIRREMHADVQGAVRGAQSLTDWRSLVGSHPWAALSVAAGVGYLVVPHRRRAESHADAIHLATALAAASQNVSAQRSTDSPKARSGAAAAVFSLLAPVMIRAAQNYALNHLEHWLATQSFRMNESGRGRQAEPSESSPANSENPTVRFRDRS